MGMIVCKCVSIDVCVIVNDYVSECVYAGLCECERAYVSIDCVIVNECIWVCVNVSVPDCECGHL